jgi:hypothetical protein
MTVPFFDANPGIVSELRSMDHDSKDYKKLLQKILLEIGGMVYLFNYLKTTDEGNRLRRKYFHCLIAAGAFIISMFIWIIVAMLLTGGREIEQFTSIDIAFFIGFLVIEIASVFLAMFFAFRGRRMLLLGVSYLIDNYTYENNSAGSVTLSNYKFEKAKLNRVAIVVGIVTFAVVFGVITLGNGTISRLFSSQTQEFSKAGMTITLTQDFHEKDVVSQTATYLSTKYIVISLKEDFQTMAQYNVSTDISLSEYAEAIIANNSISTTIEGNEIRPYFVYSRKVNGKDFTYLAMVYRGSDAYWVLTFACESKNFASAQTQFMKWADTVKVA